MEMDTKVVPVRAVELSIGAFCTEFRCEQLCDDGIFGSGPGDRPSGPNLGLGNDISWRQGLTFASKNKKCQGLAKKNLIGDSKCIVTGSDRPKDDSHGRSYRHIVSKG